LLEEPLGELVMFQLALLSFDHVQEFTLVFRELWGSQIWVELFRAGGVAVCHLQVQWCPGYLCQLREMKRTADMCAKMPLTKRNWEDTA
jgi:hypothetical protein